jgi:hypothetical protein
MCAAGHHHSDRAEFNFKITPSKYWLFNFGYGPNAFGDARGSCSCRATRRLTGPLKPSPQQPGAAGVTNADMVEPAKGEKVPFSYIIRCDVCEGSHFQKILNMTNIDLLPL